MVQKVCVPIFCSWLCTSLQISVSVEALLFFNSMYFLFTEIHINAFDSSGGYMVWKERRLPLQNIFELWVEGSTYQISFLIKLLYDTHRVFSSSLLLISISCCTTF